MQRGGKRGVSIKKSYRPSNALKKFWKNKKYVMDDFYRWANIIALVLLVYTLLLLISTSKIMERAGEIEQDTSIYGPYITGGAVESHEGIVAIEIIRNDTVETGNASYDSRPGGRGDFDVITNLRIEPSLFDVEMMFGEKIFRKVIVENIGDRTLELMAMSNIDDYVKVLDPFLKRLEPGDSMSFNVEFDAKELGINIGYITVWGDGLVAYVPIIFKVSSEVIMGEMKINIPDEFRQISSGDPIMLNVELSGFEKGIIDMSYFVKDVENNEVMRSTQKMTINGDMAFDKTLLLPEGLEDGFYVLAVELNYKGLSLIKSEIIYLGDLGRGPVLEKPAEKMFVMSKNTFQLIILLVVGLIVLIFVMYSREVSKIKQLGLEARGIFKKKKR
jgi:hypothetical protein